MKNTNARNPKGKLTKDSQGRAASQKVMSIISSTIIPELPT
ncbi:MAG TPA: hypothetical protein VIU93_07030 [Gallionellaceae bacterium]